MGGLGNQMFQYAAGRRAAYVHKTELKLDISWFNNPGDAIKRDYLLNIFTINENFATEKEISKLKIEYNNRLALFYGKTISFIIPYCKQSHVIQHFFHFDKNILQINRNVYLQGHWISEKYFADIASTIRNDFTFKNKPDKANSELIQRIRNCNSISLHVRRSDYISDKKTHDYHGVCGLDYYRKAVSFITKKVFNPTFFIFSDDPDWCKANLRLKYPTVFVSHNLGKKDYEDMRLMSTCKHNIIANSTFSWWGAWLNQNKEKIVIAPEKWFGDTSINTSDLIPSSWVKI